MDVIKQLITGGGSVLAKIFTGKTEADNHTIIMEALSPTDIHMLINGLVNENKINEAEDLLFEFMQKNPSAEIYKTGLDFFDRLSGFSDEHLTSCDYSREEIDKGLQDFKILRSQFIIF